MTGRIFRSICAVSLAVFAASFVLIMSVLYGYFSSRQMAALKEETEIAAIGAQSEGADYIKKLADGQSRITWIKSDGGVLFDNMADSSGMENHLDREEIKDALEKGEGESSRYSTTLTERRLYYAKRLDDGSVLRLSFSQLSMWALILSVMQPIAIVAGLAVLLSVLLAYRLAKKIVKPLNEIDLDHPDTCGAYEELKPLTGRIASQQNRLRIKEAELKKQRDEFAAATDGMEEGILILGKSGEVVSINKSAMRILNISGYCVGKDIALFDTGADFAEMLERARKGEKYEGTAEIEDKDYLFNASPVISGGSCGGVAVIILDVTEKEMAEKSRREFSANVSHELKTPLQNISGYAELLSGGLVRKEDEKAFLNKIYSEAQRMTSLIDDIIKLSRLDEKTPAHKEPTELHALAARAVSDTAPAAQRAGVNVTLEGSTAEVFGESELIYTMIYNLCDNAIKYNKPGGSVTVRTEELDGHAVLTVSDTGIGISEWDREHVFERFYRADKSRSRAAGGTGLGLSIVKHAAKSHNAAIKLESVPGEGTTVTVTFPPVPMDDKN